jgi:hypothetical protein
MATLVVSKVVFAGLGILNAQPKGSRPHASMPSIMRRGDWRTDWVFAGDKGVRAEATRREFAWITPRSVESPLLQWPR